MLTNVHSWLANMYHFAHRSCCFMVSFSYRHRRRRISRAQAKACYARLYYTYVNNEIIITYQTLYSDCYKCVNCVSQYEKPILCTNVQTEILLVLLWEFSQLHLWAGSRRLSKGVYQQQITVLCHASCCNHWDSLSLVILHHFPNPLEQCPAFQQELKSLARSCTVASRSSTL